MTDINDNHTTKKTREAHDAYVANRKEAGRMIDVETCEYMWIHADIGDPYCTFPRDDEEFQGACIGRCWFVCSDESDGWIEVGDLPDEKWHALQRRMERERKLWELWEAARAVHPMYEVVTHDWFFPDEIKWKGDGEEPSRDALIEWFKVNHPAQASEAESKIRRRELEIERKQAQDRLANGAPFFKRARCLAVRRTRSLQFTTTAFCNDYSRAT